MGAAGITVMHILDGANQKGRIGGILIESSVSRM
jgi:hypothetical protein